MSKQLTNPFPVSGYIGPDFFCDREEEIDLLTKAFINGRNITLIALRRLGKTALIQHFFYEVASPKKWLPIYVDLMPTSNFAEFVARLTTAIANAYPDNTVFGRKVWNWIKGVRPNITFDAYSGQPQISFETARIQEQQLSVHQLFDLLENSGRKTVIALDEFQQITNYPEKQTEGWLRSEIQKLNSINFIFCGSQQGLLGEMFNSANRPFYSSTQILNLAKLDQKVYFDFISLQMKKASKVIKDREINYILEWTRTHTWYVQTLCNRLCAQAQGKISKEVVNGEIESIFKEQEAIYFTFRELLTGPQWSLLTAIAKEKKVFAPTAGEFIRTYDLGTPASVKRSLDALLLKEMIFRQYDNSGMHYYQVYDVFLSRWLERL